MDRPELERRFLVTDPSVVEGHRGNVIVQAYLFSKDGYVVRVRRTHLPHEDGSLRDGIAMLTAKGPRMGWSRDEVETSLPLPMAIEFIKRARLKVSKTRYQLVSTPDLAWDVDVFHGDNEGLVIAECETRKPAEVVAPPWCGEEITHLRRYDNENLAEFPYSQWRDA